ncbi:MAG: MBL fold metallo-hydrolase [Bacteriovoracaceae bacterium]|jgi:glyoxylase-like metal-dependent hydrolase (beta-lactamase superfamily II)|nr:MBL fold metallo-hydrolase [Bacteriovoracaceae bacterium]
MNLKINFLDAGYCTHPECMTIRGGRLKSKIYPAMFMHIEHPKHGHILYDTGYSRDFEKETASFPNKLYAMLTPVILKDDGCAKGRLKKLGVNPEDISYIIISHFHADHISGLKDFKNAKFIYLKKEFVRVSKLKGLKALVNGVLPGLIPKDFEQRAIAIDENYKYKNYNSDIEAFFEYSYDIFGDGSIVAVDLPGHSEAQMGLYLRQEDKEYFLVADSCWLSESIRKNIGPNFMAKLITFNNKEYVRTLDKLHHLYIKNPNIKQVPSHCGEVFRELVKDCNWDTKDLNGI